MLILFQKELGAIVNVLKDTMMMVYKTNVNVKKYLYLKILVIKKINIKNVMRVAKLA